jgi:hypothetical protein
MPRIRRLALLTLLVVARPLAAQATTSDPRQVPLRPQRELRAEAVAADALGALAALGVNVRAGWYVRLGASLGAGARFQDDAPAVGEVRADAAVRFLLDPFAERRRGLYGGVGLSASHLGGGIGGRPPVLLLLAGVEGPLRNGRAWALELGLGGGVRVGLVRRGARGDGYR